MPILCMPATKIDLTNERTISDEDLAEECAKLGGTYLLTSAKTGESVETAFLQLANLIEGKA